MRDPGSPRLRVSDFSGHRGHRESALGPKKMHRVGLAVVQLTRSTFAEATAGRESLQPSALRARCTRKSSSPFRECQACRSEIVANTDQIIYRGEFPSIDCSGP